MARSMCFLVCDERETAEKLKSFGLQNGLTVQVYTTTEWKRGLRDSAFLTHVSGEGPSLAMGGLPQRDGATIIPFPNSGSESEDGSRVPTINEVEAKAIESAINEFNGNLTEAAKALGIGRATLYRKVKLYKLDPNAARRKRAA